MKNTKFASAVLSAALLLASCGTTPSPVSEPVPPANSSVEQVTLPRSEAESEAMRQHFEALVAELKGEHGLYRTSAGLLAVRDVTALSDAARDLAQEAVQRSNDAVKTGDYRLDDELFLIPAKMEPQASVSFRWNWAGLVVYITLSNQEASNATGYLSGILGVGGGVLYRIPYAAAALAVASGLATIVGTHCNRNGRGSVMVIVPALRTGHCYAR